MRSILKIAPLLLSTAFIGHDAFFRTIPFADHITFNKSEYMPEIDQDPKVLNCTPIAYADTVLWLDDNGYYRLMSESTSSLKSRNSLVNELSSYMQTDNYGTNIYTGINGFVDFVRHRGYEPEVKYTKFSPTNSKRLDQSVLILSDKPNLDLIENGTEGLSNVVLTLKELKYDSNEKEYTLTMNHSVAVSTTNRIDSNTLDIEVKDGLKEFGKLRLTYLEDQNTVKKIWESLPIKIREDELERIRLIKCEQLDNRPQRHRNRLLLVWDIASFKINDWDPQPVLE